jgi:hypothetical protein
MTVYTQQINSIVEKLTIAEQKFMLEFILNYKIHHDCNKDNTAQDKDLPDQKETVRNFIKAINSAGPLEYDPIDEILTRGVSLT